MNHKLVALHKPKSWPTLHNFSVTHTIYIFYEVTAGIGLFLGLKTMGKYGFIAKEHENEKQQTKFQSINISNLGGHSK